MFLNLIHFKHMSARRGVGLPHNSWKYMCLGHLAFWILEKNVWYRFFSESNFKISGEKCHSGLFKHTLGQEFRTLLTYAFSKWTSSMILPWNFCWWFRISNLRLFRDPNWLSLPQKPNRRKRNIKNRANSRQASEKICKQRVLGAKFNRSAV